MYAAIAPKWWRVLVAIISVKTLRPPKLVKALRAPKLMTLSLDPRNGYWTILTITIMASLSNY